MTIVELYINNRLCDVGRDFGVRLNRQLLNPGELNTKDAQYSYSITLPPTSNNHAIFNFANIEETKDKFNRQYNAELIINSVRVFVGLFRLSEVTRDKYKGNLYIPATKSIKDIFGELKLNENPEYRIEFKDFAEYVSRYNILAATGPQMAIFPYTLYGVLPKVPLNHDANNYSPRNIWDDSVRMGMQDLAPSINPLLMLKHIFSAKGYNLVGTAFDDERLTRLYMSYKNDADYVQPWNYGYHGQIHLEGEWSNRTDKKSAPGNEDLEKAVFEAVGDRYLYACDLLNCTNVKITGVNDPGGNVLSSEYTENNRKYVRTQIMIPATGYYKIHLKTSVLFYGDSWSKVDPDTGVLVLSDRQRNHLSVICSSIKILRDRKKGDFGLNVSRMDGSFYRDNLPQNPAADMSRDYPLYMPAFYGDRGSINYVDLAQNEYMVAGIQWGRINNNDVSLLDDAPDPINRSLSQIMIAKPAISWDTAAQGAVRNYTAINNPEGFKKWDLPNEGDSPRWQDTDRFRCVLNGSPESYAKLNIVDGHRSGSEGELYGIAWLEAGELLTLADVSDQGTEYYGVSRRGWFAKDVSFELDISPFQTGKDWLKLDEAGTQIPDTTMNWNDPVSFDVDSINLVGFLPADMKTDDFIDNFCKAFNLQLTQIDATTFELNVKQSKAAVSNLFINLDNLASVHDRSNTPLGLPSLYKLGFTVDVEEEGYVTTGDDGGGEFETGVTEKKIVEQKSNFSFNWFKNITKQQSGGNIVMPLAVISKHEVWTSKLSYPDAMKKRYPNQALRFWYPDGLLNDLGATFDFNGKSLSIAKVSNELTGLSILNYKNKKLTILTNYFTLLINGGSHYTEVEGYLTPDQYDDINGSIMAMFNGDLYYVAEISGFDPMGRNKTKIKLIRKI